MHINIYGPPGSGKTQHALEFKEIFNCEWILDEQDIISRDFIDASLPTLLLSQNPINRPGIKIIHISLAKQLIKELL